MTNTKYTQTIIGLLAMLLMMAMIGCERNIEDLEPATFPTNGDVFIDGFSGGLSYAVFGGADLTAFDVDQDIAYQGSASMRFDVPDVGDPAGAYAGGAFLDEGGRDLTGYDALTFWARASTAATIDLVGFGADFDQAKYQVSLSNLKVNSAWKKFIIPLPDPSKLTRERGMFYYSEGPEEGRGYTFWIDELKFEKLGTIAHPNPAILETQDQVISAATGDRLPIGGIFAEFNILDGANAIDQRVDIAPSYLTFSSSASNIATVSELGVVSVLDSGSVVITAKLNDIDARGSLTLDAGGDPVAPLTPAPTPTTSPDSVISMFSNAYTDVLIDTWNTRWLNSTAENFDIQVAGDDIKKYTMLNFVGIEFASQTIDATNMTHFHLDLWTPDPTALPASFKILLIDFGANGIFDGGDDVSHELSFTSPTLMTENWVSLDIPLSNFSGLTTRAHLAQLVLSGDLQNIFIDNVYFANRGAVVSSGPTMAAPTPTRNAADVISVFSDAYTNLSGIDLNPDWGQTTSVSQVSIAGNNTLFYAGLNYQGLDLGGNQDVSAMSHVHMDIWTENSSALNAYLISDGPVEADIAVTVPTSGWLSLDIPLSDFSSVDISNLIQFKFDGNGDIYLDNIYFYKTSGNSNEPTAAAPMPTRDPGNVISIFSDAYANVGGTNFNPDWGQATVVTEVPVVGNNTLLYTGLDYQGIELDGSQDVSAMSHVHLDIWTANSSLLNAFLISTGPVETPYAVTVPTSGWASLDIPLTTFSPVNLADLIQFKFDGNGDIYIDNIYFYKDGPPPTEPTVAAPTPTRDAANVISVYSDAYTNIMGTNFNPDWGQATVFSEMPIAGNNTIRYGGLDYQGIEFSGSQDASGMSHFHIDVWTANSTALSAFLISTGPVETPSVLPVPTSGWASLDIPLTDFSPVDFADLIQLKFEGNGDIYIDNIYFYSMGVVSEPELPLTFENGETLIPFDNGATAVNVANPDMNGNPSARVLEFNKVVGSEWYSGVVFDELLRTTPLIDLANGTVFTVKIWSPKAGIQVRFQLEGGVPDPATTPAYEVFQTITTANQWVTLTFDFTSQVNATDRYQKFSLFPDFDVTNMNPVAVGAIYYIDDITQQ
jgi:hypothetical protein